MPKTKRKKVTTKKSAPKKTVKATAVKRSQTGFSQEFTNALLVIFGAGMVLFAYVIFKVYGA